MRISVVTVSFNQAEYLESCIRSVIEQDHDDIEYIVVDPGSNDGSREIITQYREKISHLVLEPDRGPADGLNKGFARASGEILCYLNADDVLLMGALRSAEEYFRRHPRVDVLMGHGYQIDEVGRRVKRIFSTRWSLRNYAFGSANAVQQATFFKVSTFKAAKGFNAENRTCWDGELLVDMALAGARMKTVPAEFGSFRIYPQSITGSGRLRDAYLQDQERLREKILGRLPTAFDGFERELRRALKLVGHPYQTCYKAMSRTAEVMSLRRVKRR